jgi:hypothetical protein
VEVGKHTVNTMVEQATSISMPRVSTNLMIRWKKPVEIWRIAWYTLFAGVEDFQLFAIFLRHKDVL